MYLYLVIYNPPATVIAVVFAAEYSNLRPAMLKHARALGPCPAALARPLVPSLNVRFSGSGSACTGHPVLLALCKCRPGARLHAGLS